MADLAFRILLYTLLVIITAACGSVLLFAFFLARFKSRYGHLPTPKQESFFMGHIPFMNEVKRKLGLRPIALIDMWTREFGPVFCVRLVLRPWVMCSCSQTTKEVCLDSRHPKSHYMYAYFESIYGARFIGKGLVSQTNHQKWKTQRSRINPVFTRRYLINMMDSFNACADTMCQHLVPQADRKTLVPMLNIFHNITLDVIAKIGFDLEINATRNPDNPFSTAVSRTLTGLNRTFMDPLSAIDPRKLAAEFRRATRDACGLVRDVGRKCIQKRNEDIRSGCNVPNDILTGILKTDNALEGGDDADVEEMVDEFVTLFVAGQETTANLLAFTLLQVGRHSDVDRRLKEEVDQVLGSKSFLEYEDLGKLEYMDLVFKETMRLNPPVSGTTRDMAFDVKCGMYTLPKGATVTFQTASSSRREEYFEDPVLFNPERFLSKEARSEHVYAYFPFSLGQRNCIGQHFALIESKVILAKLIQGFDIRLEQSQRHITVDEVTNKPLDRCLNYFSLRE